MLRRMVNVCLVLPSGIAATQVSKTAVEVCLAICASYLIGFVESLVEYFNR